MIASKALTLKSLACLCVWLVSGCLGSIHSTISNDIPDTLVSPLLIRENTTTTATADTFLKLLEARRTHYSLTKDLPLSADRIQEIVNHCMKVVPSPFNSQSNRLVVLFGAEHDTLWDLGVEALRSAYPAGQDFEPTATRFAGFKAAAGTILFFEDQKVVSNNEAKFPGVAQHMSSWALQSDAMLQFALWTALDAVGVGCNLQHYPVGEVAAQKWDIPAEWKLNAQLVFGGKTSSPPPKPKLPTEETVRVLGA